MANLLTCHGHIPSSFPNVDLMKRTASECEATVLASLDAVAAGLSELRYRNGCFVKQTTARASISGEEKRASEALL
jgi:hypothetical protein